MIDILGRAWLGDCLGCAIGDGTYVPPGGIIRETPHFVLHQDPEVPIAGFLIIGARRHCQSISQLTRAESQDLFDLCYAGRP